MTYMRFSLLLLLALSSFGCTASNEPTPQRIVTLPFDPNLPAHKRDYDAAKGRLQIARIFYDQVANASILTDTDEVIVLWTDRRVSTEKWFLNAGDSTQNYDLPAFIDSSLYIYTKSLHGIAPNELALGLNSWIWNNTNADTAYLYDERRNIVDTLSY